MRPFFSVVIPTYNSADKIKRAINSLLSQTFGDFEILIMDDGSTDNTAEVVASFSDQRIIYEWDFNSGGPAKPRNRGISLATGEWICFLDADDWWTSDKLQVCFNCINEKVDFIHHDLELVSEHHSLLRRKVLKSRQLNAPVLTSLLIHGNCIFNSSAVVRKRLLTKIGGINETRELSAAEDYNTWLKIANLTDQFIYLPNILGFYLSHNQSISKKDMSAPTRLAVKDFLGALNIKQKNMAEASIKYTSGRYNYLAGNNVIAKEDLLISLRYCQLKIKLKILWMIFILKFLK